MTQEHTSIKLFLPVFLFFLSVQISHAQISEKTSSPQQPESDRQSEAKTLKKLSLKELMDLEVTSVSRHSEKLVETPSAIQVITQKEIIRSGVTSIPEALRLASNLNVAQIDSRQWAISARGFNNSISNKLLVLMDGRTLYTPLFAGVFWDVQDTLLEDIDRIEVISGPGATLWGANAVNGVINITTMDAKDTQGLMLIGRAGTELRGVVGARYGDKIGSNAFYRVYGKYSDRDSTQFSNGRDGADEWHNGQGGFRIDCDKNEIDHFTIQGDLYNGRFDQFRQPEGKVSGGNIVTRWSRVLSPGSQIKVQFFYDRTNRDIPNTFLENLDTYDFDFQHHFNFNNRHEIVWGAGYRLTNDDITNGITLAFLPPQLTHHLFSSFVQDQIAIIKDKFYLTYGTKLEHNSYTGFEFQPSGRVTWKLDTQRTIWGAVSRAVRTPSRIDRDFFAPPQPPFLLAGGPNFESEELIAYELGYRSQQFEHISLSIAPFYHDYDHVRSLEQIHPPFPFPIVFGNGKSGQAYGAELSAEIQATDRWLIRTGYTELQIHIRPKPGSTDPTAGSAESHDSNHQFLLRSSLDLPKNLQFDSTFRAVSRIANQKVPAYAELDLRLAWAPNSALELSIVGQNLLHSGHVEFGAPASSHEIQRSMYGKIVWHF
jgi:iron complex outermembrane receptor protein